MTQPICPDCGRASCLIFQWAEARRRSTRAPEERVTPRAFFNPPLVGVPVVPGLADSGNENWRHGLVLPLGEPYLEPSYVNVPADAGAIRATTGRLAGTPSAESSDPSDGP